MTFVLTVPHYVCADGQWARRTHVCDPLAGEAADVLASRLREHGAEVVGPIKGDTPRMTADLNRRAGRETAWRKGVSSRIKAEAATATVCLVDVHSYDIRAKWNRWADERGNPNPALVFLDGRLTPGIAGVPELLMSKFSPEWRRLIEVGGSPENDIVATAATFGASSAVLVEFDEERDATDPGWLHSAADALAVALIEMMQK